MSQIPFKHKMAAHCESGTIAGLLNHHGLAITEPMVFGLSSALFFGYIKMPSFTFPMFFVRSKPGAIRKKIAKRLGVEFCIKKYKRPEDAKKELDELLEKNIPVAVKVDFFYMNYLKAWMRVHNNAHFITIIGKEGTKYLISDSYYQEIAELDEDILLTSRFAKGMDSPKGLMYYIKSIPKEIDFEKNIMVSIKKTIYNMLKIPMPFLGVKGIHRFGDRITGWPKLARDPEHLAHEVMKINLLLEEQGTGGAGFRFMYATYLQQASEMLKNKELLGFSKRMMNIGDSWREVSLAAIRMNKNYDMSEERFKELSELLHARAEDEKSFFTDLSKFVKNYKK